MSFWVSSSMRLDAVSMPTLMWRMPMSAISRATSSVTWWARIDGRTGAVAGALEAVGLSAIADAPVRILSTGQRRRGGLARVVASGAPIWLLDEPTSGLDDAAVDLVAGLIARHRTEGGIALVATHQPLDLPHAQEIAL